MRPSSRFYRTVRPILGTLDGQAFGYAWRSYSNHPRWPIGSNQGKDHRGRGGSSMGPEAQTQRLNELSAANIKLGKDDLLLKPGEKGPEPITAKTMQSIDDLYEGPSRTLHVIGNNETSNFLAKHLIGVYENIKFCGDFSESPSMIQPDDEGPIEHLLITGRASQVSQRVAPFKSRFVEDSVICSMAPGLGIAETLREEVFYDRTMPQFVMGAVDPNLLYGHKRKMANFNPKNLHTRLAYVQPINAGFAPLASRRLMSQFRAAVTLNTITPPFERWLKHKLSNLVFSAVLDPICAILQCKYQDITHNRWAGRLAMALVAEIETIIASFPELKGAHFMNQMINNQGLRREIFGKLHATRATDCRMAIQVREGLPTDIDFINGYFVRRALAKSIPCPVNEMVISMVNARRLTIELGEDNQVPFHVTSKNVIWE